MSMQRPLTGEFKLVMHVSGSGRASCYVLHLPSRTSSYGNVLLSKFDLWLSDQELLDGDWGSLLARAALGAQAGL